MSSSDFYQLVQSIFREVKNIDLCVYCAGIGQVIDYNNLEQETLVFKVNLMAAIKFTELSLEYMLNNDKGHFIGLSSIIDGHVSTGAPSYCASKAGVSKFWDGLGLGLKDSKFNVKVSNIRFGFVDTKMAKSNIKPFLLTVDDATEFILKIIRAPKIRATNPKRAIFLMWLLSIKEKFRLLFE